MEIIRLKNKEQTNCLQNSVVAIGYFDGLHLGHMQLLKKVIDISRQTGLKKGFMTFDRHPKEVFGQSDFQYLMSLQQKQHLVEQMGFDYFFIIKFDRAVASKDPQTFIDNYIIKNQIRHVVCGFDFHFGKNGQGDINTLKACSHSFYEVDVIKKYEIDHKKVSSSLIRHCIHQGKIQRANYLLDRPYRITGQVIHGRKNGHKLGFPTANVAVGQYVVLKRGVYAVYIYVEGCRYKGMANIGINPTLGSLKQISLEVHILDFNDDIYDQTVDVDFIEHIRDEVHFQSVNELIEQLNRDKKYIDRILD